MNSIRWAGFLGAGVVLSSCAGYSSLGDLPSGGGEAGESGSKGGQGHGGARATGGTGMGAFGGSMDATGGTTGMGAYGGSMDATGGTTGMGAYGGTMDATGGTGMGAYGGTADATGGTGMGAYGGTSDGRCMVAEECPSTPPSCVLCDDGSTVCAEAVCWRGQCGIAVPECPEGPCAKRLCGEPCMAPDGVAGQCDESGQCTDDSPCAAPGTCNLEEDCPSDADCRYCGEDACVESTCLDGQCAQVCPTSFMCSSPMDCPKDLTDDPCSTGPWECVRGFCAREYQECSAPPLR